MIDNEKKNIVDEYLSHNGTNFSELKEKIYATTEGEINDAYIYSSHFDNLGSKLSDLDIYVIREKTINSKPFPTIQQLRINNLDLDIEVWDYHTIYSMFNNLNNNMDFDSLGNLKVLLRIATGLSINGKTRFQGSIIMDQLKATVTKIYMRLSRSYYDDAIKLSKTENFFSALDELRRATWWGIAAYNTQMGIVNLKEKWITKIFLTNSKNSLIKREYMRLQFDTAVDEKNVKDVVDEYLDFISDIYFKISVKEW